MSCKSVRAWDTAGYVEEKAAKGKLVLEVKAVRAKDLKNAESESFIKSVQTMAVRERSNLNW